MTQFLGQKKRCPHELPYGCPLSCVIVPYMQLARANVQQRTHNGKKMN
jgi:hypothetical protein